LNNYYPNEIYAEEAFRVLAIHPSRTMIEKILLLHEEYNREDESKMRTNRMSRHYYDLFRIYQLPQCIEVLKDAGFINDIIEHRKGYSRLRHFNYDTLCIGKIALIPQESILAALQSDYEQMSQEMMYGNAPTFKQIIEVIRSIQNEFNQKGDVLLPKISTN
jgi:hypothetical protein